MGLINYVLQSLVLVNALQSVLAGTVIDSDRFGEGRIGIGRREVITLEVIRQVTHLETSVGVMKEECLTLVNAPEEIFCRVTIGEEEITSGLEGSSSVGMDLTSSGTSSGTVSVSVSVSPSPAYSEPESVSASDSEPVTLPSLSITEPTSITQSETVLVSGVGSEVGNDTVSSSESTLSSTLVSELESGVPRSSYSSGETTTTLTFTSDSSILDPTLPPSLAPTLTLSPSPGPRLSPSPASNSSPVSDGASSMTPDSESLSSETVPTSPSDTVPLEPIPSGQSESESASESQSQKEAITITRSAPLDPSTSPFHSGSATLLNPPVPSSASSSSLDPDVDATAAAAAEADSKAKEIPGQRLQVLPIGLGVFGGLVIITLAVVGYVLFERRKYKKQFRSRRLAEAGLNPAGWVR